MAGFPELYVLRHGETEWNRQGRWQGVLDSPLTETGREQARAVGALLTEIGVTPSTHRFFVSPQGRARQTARIVLDDAAEPVTDDRLSEIGVGDWAGMRRDEIIAAAGLPPGTDFLEHYRVAPGGEPFEALYARVAAFLSDLTGPSVVVTHGITSRFLRAAALGWGVDRVGELPGGQGVVHRVRDGWHETLDASGPAG